MSTSANTKKKCVTCNKSGGILICDGCQQIFCGKHVTEHRQNLSGQLDGIMQEHDLFQNDIERISIDHSALQKIDQWEKESIAKIRLAAKTSRKNLQIVLDQSKERFSKISGDMAAELRASREADDYSENDFIHWTEQLKKLKLEIKSPSLGKIIADEKSAIHLIKIDNNESNNKQSALSTTASNLKIQEKFVDVVGPVKLENGGYFAKHTGSAQNYSFILGNLPYSHGQHTTRFKLEKCHLPYHIFFGCISYPTALKDDVLRSSNTVGWSGSNQVYEHGRCSSNCKISGYNSDLIKTNDILHITFDCDKNQMKLFNKRLNKTNTLKVDINKTPYPWRLLMVMFHKKDCVRILPNI